MAAFLATAGKGALKIKIGTVSFPSHDAAFSELQRQYDKGACWKSKLVPGRRANGDVCLVCKLCGKELGCTNPHDTARKHACPTALTMAATPATPAETAEPSGASAGSTTSQTPGPRQSQLQAHYPTAHQKHVALARLAMFFFTSGTAFRKVENQYLVESYKALGVALPCEKKLRTTMLDEAYEMTSKKMAGEMAKTLGAFQIITDGWKSKYCEHSAQLVTVITTLLDGGSIFQKVG
jgi:hypothetical protein